MKKVSIIGAGWLGQTLAAKLAEQGYCVTATSRDLDKLKKIQAKGIKTCQLDLDNLLAAKLDEAALKAVFDTDIVIGCFPPGFRSGRGHNYLKYWLKLTDYCNQYAVKRLVFCSSTAVYPEIAQSFTESDLPLALTEDITTHELLSEKGLALWQVEAEVAKAFNGELMVCRLAGLFGPDRDPANFVKRLKAISSKMPVNMVHREDVVAAIHFLLTLNTLPDVINISCPEQMSKRAFYQLALDARCQDESLQDKVDNQQAGKHISSQKLIELGYQFIYSEQKKALVSLQN
ncbi:NAD-dependent epimerase/dehydratase family protein [Catenovulum sp. SM1970]|uniref:NAD-dependent epimerase/dehydratase family protein n=1 Tax=Marinifaba aquimaris TaxID=2741323 RepID=UPI001571DECE|nr:NAD-dependent epimerase/dehydratase family protein [Marinifaba aquimaris]NTS75544.1 NAD-dependent epimerase/dehydratase family protein [Marinifaba aquimaris]